MPSFHCMSTNYKDAAKQQTRQVSSALKIDKFCRQVIRKYLKMSETASMHLIWTYLADAEHGLDLLLSMD